MSPTDPSRIDNRRGPPGAHALLARLNAVLCETGRRLAGALLGAMVAIVLVQILFRYGLNNSLAWTEEIAKTLMVWLTMLVAPWAWRTGAQVNIDLFRAALPVRVRAGLDIAVTLTVLWIVSVLFIESLDLVARGWSARAATVPVPTAVFYAILPPAFALLALVGAERLLGALTMLRTGQDLVRPDGEGAA